MNYQGVYDRLIARALVRRLAGYGEDHHILPRCLGGSDAADNLARLTAEEHYLAHQLLVKIHPTHVMTTRRIPGRSGNKLYGWLRRRMAAAQTGQKRDPAAVEKGSASLKAAIMTPEARARKLLNLRLPKNCTVEVRRRMAEAQRGKKHSPETVAKRSAAISARYAITPKPKHTEQTRAKMRASRLAYLAAQAKILETLLP